MLTPFSSPIKLFLVVTVFLLSCSRNKKFNSFLWKQKSLDWQITDVRENMLKDLIQSDTLINKSRKEIYNLLGSPNLENESKLKYLVREKYSNNIDPDYIVFLCIENDENGVVKHYYVGK